jgi:predicted RNase H-like HicB family nuclease
MTKRTADELRRLPYRRKVDLIEEEDGRYFVGFIIEIPSIRVFADTHHEARHLLEDTFVDLLEAMVEAGDDIPTPIEWPESMGTPARPRWGRPTAGKGVTYVNPADLPAMHDLPAIDEDRKLVAADTSAV